MPTNPKSLVVFDFDGTLYTKDSLIDFCLFYYRSKPLRRFYVFKQFLAFILWKVKIIDTTTFKHKFISFIGNDSEEEITRMAELFWDKTHKFNPHLLNILDQYQKASVPVLVLSASPELFISPACQKLNIPYLLGTPLTVEKSSYRLGTNCRGREKINRFKEKFPESEILEAYSDNKDDIYLLQMAKKGWWVVRGEIVAMEGGAVR